MTRLTRDRIYFRKEQETHRRTIFEHNGSFYVKWNMSYVEVENSKGYWRTTNEEMETPRRGNVPTV